MSFQMMRVERRLEDFRNELFRAADGIDPSSVEMIDTGEFALKLGGIQSFRRVPGISEHMGFGLEPYRCGNDGDVAALRGYLSRMFGITDIQTLRDSFTGVFCLQTEYGDFYRDWNGNPLFDVASLDLFGASAYTRSRDFALHLRRFVEDQGFLAWDVGERVMVIRQAYACGLITLAQYSDLLREQAVITLLAFRNFAEFAVSELAGAVYYMFTCLNREEDDGLEGFLDINMRLVRELFDAGTWHVGIWSKNFKPLAIAESQIRQLLDESYRGKKGTASDRILCDGYRIGAMSRGEPKSEDDSGWVFMAGDEDEWFISAGNTGFVDLNLIINYSPEAAQFLDMPVGTVLARDEQGDLVVISGDLA